MLGRETHQQNCSSSAQSRPHHSQVGQWVPAAHPTPTHDPLPWAVGMEGQKAGGWGLTPPPHHSFTKGLIHLPLHLPF